MNELVTIETRHGRYPVHKHWLDPLADIIRRYEVMRQKGHWQFGTEEQEWYWVEDRP